MANDDAAIPRRSYVSALAGLFGGTLGSGTATALPEGDATAGEPLEDSITRSTTASRDADSNAVAVSANAYKWTAQHSTHVELGNVHSRDDGTESEGDPVADVLTNTTLSLLGASWEDFGNPAKGSSDDDQGTGCWRYTFRLNSFAFALTPKHTEWFPVETEDKQLSVLSKEEGYEPASELFNYDYWVALSDFVRVQGPDPSTYPRQAQRVAVAARRDPDLFGIANGRRVMERLSRCLETAEEGCLGDGRTAEDFRTGLRAIVEASRGEDVLNAAKLRAQATEQAQDSEAVQNLTLAALGIASIFATGGTLGAVILAIDVALAVVEFFFNDNEFETPYNRGFEVETPLSSDKADALASHFVTFDVYATPGESTRFTVDSRHEYEARVLAGEHKQFDLDRAARGEGCAPKWTVGVRAPAEEDASPELIYDGIEPVRADFERNESQPPQPGISFHGGTRPPGENDTYDVEVGETFEVHAYDSLLSKTRFSYRDIDWTLEYNNECDLRPAECNNHGIDDWKVVDEGSGWEWSFTPDEGGEYRVSVTIGGARPSATTQEQFTLHPVPEVEIVSPDSGWADVEAGSPVSFRGNASFDDDAQLFTFWKFPAEARGRGDDDVDPREEVRAGDPSTIVHEPEDVGSGVSFTFTETGLYEVTYVATDANGHKSMTSVDVNVSPGDASSNLDPTLSEHVHANVRLGSSKPVRVGESARLVASDSRADGPRRIIGFDWDLSGTGENFTDLSGDGAGSLEGQLAEATIEVPPGGEFTSTGEETVQVLAYAIDPEAGSDSGRLVADLAEFTFTVEATTEPDPAVTPISKSHPLARQHQKIKPIGDDSYWSRATVQFFTAYGTEMASSVSTFRWQFEVESASPVEVTRRTSGAVFHEFSGTGEFVVALTAVYSDGRESTTRHRVTIG